jgi:hypothetical protein
MNFIEKFYIKQCATEVQIMLERMKQRPEDFDYGTGWRKLVELADSASSPYTPIERKMIRKYWKECQNTRNRNELLSRIMSETINPTTREYMEDAMSGQYTRSLAQSMQNTKQQLASGILTSYTDARAIYGNPLQNRHQP